MKIIVFDTEATDLTPGQICQLSYLIVEDGKEQWLTDDAAGVLFQGGTP